MSHNLVCFNCDRKIAEFEQHYLHNGQVFCCDCNAVKTRAAGKSNYALELQKISRINKGLIAACAVLCILSVILIFTKTDSEEGSRLKKENAAMSSDISKLKIQIEAQNTEFEELKKENARLEVEAAKVPKLISATKAIIAKSKAESEQYQQLLKTLGGLKLQAKGIDTLKQTQRAAIEPNVTSLPPTSEPNSSSIRE